MELAKQPFDIHLLSSKNGFSYEYQGNGINGIQWDKIYDVLIQAKVLSPNSRILQYKEFTPWERGGAETYICVIGIKSINVSDPKKENEQKIIVKALILLVADLTAYAIEWVNRAHQLGAAGVRTGVFGSEKACVYQSYLPESLQDNLLTLTRRDMVQQFRERIQSLMGLCWNVGRLGFKPLSLFNDLRVMNNEIALVDLGEDLGGITSNNTVDYTFDFVADELNRFAKRGILAQKYLEIVNYFGQKRQ